MAKPEASEAALELYEALSPSFTDGDEGRDWPTLRFCIALTAPAVSEIHDYVTDTEGRPGWQVLLDPQRAPAKTLPWLGQFDGARMREDMDEEARRAAIVHPEAFGRGTVAAMRSVAERRLTGTKSVLIEERYTGRAWWLRITTLTGETPEPTVTQAEIIAEQKPIGIVLFFNTRATWTWKTMYETPAYNTWLKVRTEAPTWFVVRTHEP